eukprot:364688-Chlamydomonas_euryale.AAC.8
MGAARAGGAGVGGRTVGVRMVCGEGRGHSARFGAGGKPCATLSSTTGSPVALLVQKIEHHNRATVRAAPVAGGGGLGRLTRAGASFVVDAPRGSLVHAHLPSSVFVFHNTCSSASASRVDQTEMTPSLVSHRKDSSVTARTAVWPQGQQRNRKDSSVTARTPVWPQGQQRDRKDTSVAARTAA